MVKLLRSSVCLDFWFCSGTQQEVASCCEEEQESSICLHQGDFNPPVSQVSFNRTWEMCARRQVTRGQRHRCVGIPPLPPFPSVTQNQHSYHPCCCIQSGPHNMASTVCIFENLESWNSTKKCMHKYSFTFFPFHPDVMMNTFSTTYLNQTNHQLQHKVFF